MATITYYLQRNVDGVINTYPNVWVRLNNNITFVDYISTDKTDVDGEFTIVGVPAGSYTVFIGPTGTVVGTPAAIGDSNFLVPVIVTPAGVEGIVAKSAVAEMVLSTINPTTVFTYTHGASRDWLVDVYIRIVTGVTAITLTLTYTDSSGAQTVNYMTARILNTGSYLIPELYFRSLASAITLTATADIANQAYITASLIGVD